MPISHINIKSPNYRKAIRRPRPKLSKMSQANTRQGRVVRPRRRRLIIRKLTKTPRPGGDRRGLQTQYTTSRNIPPGYKVSSISSGRKAWKELKDSGAIFVKSKTRTPPRKLKSVPGGAGGYTPGGPSQWHIDHGYVVSKDTGQPLYNQMSSMAPTMQAAKRAIEATGAVAVWDVGMNAWVVKTF